MSKKNTIATINRDEIVATTYTDSAIINSAIRARKGDTHISVELDSDGNEYAKATYQLVKPIGNRSEISTTNMELATSIERVQNALALGDVSYFVVAKELERMTETEATELGFDNVVAMACAIFGFAKSTVENYRKLARFFIGDDYELVGAIPKDTPISTLNQLLSYVTVDDFGNHDISNVERLFTSNIITPYMKQAELKCRLAKLKTMETDKELSQLDSDEIKIIQDEISKDSAERKENKGKTNTEKKNTVTVSDNPTVLCGEALNKIKELKEVFLKLNLDFDFMALEEIVNNHIDTLEN